MESTVSQLPINDGTPHSADGHRHETDLVRRSAERANLTKSQFVTALGHELRTPLQAITCFIEAMGGTLELTSRVGRAPTSP